MTIAFLLTSLVIVATPGTGAVYTVNAGLLRGRRAAVLAAAACVVGIVPHLVVAVSGLAALLRADRTAYAVLIWLGIGYLLFMAWGSWRDPGVEFGAAVSGSRSVLRDGVVLNLLNPKLTLFFLAFLPQFVGPRDAVDAAVAMTALGAVFMALTFGVFTGYGVLAASARPALRRRPQLLGRAGKGFALCYLVLAAGLVVQQVS